MHGNEHIMHRVLLQKFARQGAVRIRSALRVASEPEWMQSELGEALLRWRGQTLAGGAIAMGLGGVGPI
jgi:hypothetical protein